MGIFSYRFLILGQRIGGRGSKRLFARSPPLSTPGPPPVIHMFGDKNCWERNYKKPSPGLSLSLTHSLTLILPPHSTSHSAVKRERMRERMRLRMPERMRKRETER